MYAALDAVMKYRPHAGAKYDKVDEIPFDFNHKLPSVAVRAGDAWRPARTKKSLCGSASSWSGVDVMRRRS